MVVRLGHLINGDWCHAFSVKDRAWTAIQNRTKPFAAEDCLLPDGSSPRPYSRLVCGTCKMTVYPTNLKVLKDKRNS